MPRSPLLLLLAALLALSATACTSLEAGQEPAQAAPELPPPPRPEITTPAKPKWQGPARRAYVNAYRMCTVFTVKETARYFGVQAKPKAVAQAHAVELYARPKLVQAATAGCLRAIRAKRAR